MQDIKVGDYVRSYDGYIGKVTKVIERTRDCDTYYATDTVMASGFYEHIKSHSEDIKDLVELGDYVNGIEVETIYGYDQDGNDEDKLGIMLTDIDYAYGVYLEDVVILDILTKEQFEREKYQVKKIRQLFE